MEQVGGYREGDFPEDYDLWLRLTAAGFSLAKLDAVMLRWRRHEAQLTFTDARCSRPAFRAHQALHLAARVKQESAFLIWGAGPTGRRLAGALRAHDAWPAAFIDIDPLKVGQTKLGGARVESPSILDVTPRPFIVIAVGVRGAREIIRAQLDARALIEGRDYLFAS